MKRLFLSKFFCWCWMFLLSQNMDSTAIKLSKITIAGAFLVGGSTLDCRRPIGCFWCSPSLHFQFPLGNKIYFSTGGAILIGGSGLGLGVPIFFEKGFKTMAARHSSASEGLLRKDFLLGFLCLRWVLAHGWMLEKIISLNWAHEP